MRIPGLLALCFCVFWPVTIWYVERLLDKSDEPLGVVSLIAFVAVILLRQGTVSSNRFGKIPIAAIACLVLYVATWPVAPKLFSAIIAVAAIGFLIDSQAGKFKLSLGSWLLLLFSLPIVSSLNFYSGYPLRLVVGKIAAPLISMVGFPTIADGTALIWNSQMIQIDAPCSGIKMLWFALFVGAILSSIMELSFFNSAAVLSSAVLAALLGNVLRITSLFFIEAKVLPIEASQEHFIHQSVGAVSFAIAAGVTVFVARLLAGGSERSAPISEGNNSPEAKLLTKRTIVFLALCAVACIMPLALPRNADNLVSTRAFPGWLIEYRGAPIEPVPPQKADLAFYQEFPGKIQCFKQGARRVILRWVAKPTRQLHPSSDCFKGGGFDVSWQPLITDADGNRWSTFTARKAENKFIVHERIYDGKGENWTDISSWYWAALLGKTHGPWWSVVEIESSS